MPLVFVHGIGNRPGIEFDAKSRERDEYFRRFLFPVIGGRPDENIASPVWGASGALLRWQGASLPRGRRHKLGVGESDDVCIEAAATESFETEDRLLLAIARRDLADAIDLLFSIEPPEDDDNSQTEDIVGAAERMIAYCQAREQLRPEPDATLRYPWLESVQDDVGLINALWRESRGWSLTADGTPIYTDKPAALPTLGTGSDRPPGRLARAVGALRRACVRPPTVGLATTVRMTMAERSMTVIGDIFAYLADRGDQGHPGAIPQLVTEAIAEAAERRESGCPLVVVAHSMGGNIVYDALTHFRPDLVVDVLVTVGSQVGLFEELALFRASVQDQDPPSKDRPRVPKPPNIRRWINIVDRADVLAFCAEPIFDGAEDFDYPSSALWAHGAYFREPNFHLRLANRVRDALK